MELGMGVSPESLEIAISVQPDDQALTVHFWKRCGGNNEQAATYCSGSIPAVHEGNDFTRNGRSHGIVCVRLDYNQISYNNLTRFLLRNFCWTGLTT